MARRRRTTTLRSSSSHKSHKSGLGKWVSRLVGLAIIVLVAWWGWSMYTAWGKTMAQLSLTGGHAFVTSQADSPVVLIVQQGSDPTILDSLAVVKFNYRQHSLQAIQLPNNLSDGQTTAAEYLRSGYYKELQQLVEQTIALPINGYIMQPAQTTSPTSQNWSNLLLRQPKPSWWNTTVGAPWWLAQQPVIKTNYSIWELRKMVWLSRDADDQKVNIQSAEANLFSNNDQSMLVADTQQMDQLVDSVLTDQAAKALGLSVVVKNGTDVGGLATLVSRYVHHLGGEVIAVEAADSAQATSSMTAEKASLVSKNITSLLGIPLTTEARTGRERSDIEIVIGVDVLQRVGKPIGLPE